MAEGARAIGTSINACDLSDRMRPSLERDDGEPTFRRLHRLFQEAILRGEIPPGTPIPPSRVLAKQLRIARNTVLHVYKQLRLEGFVASTPGMGTFVLDTSPQQMCAVNGSAPGRSDPEGSLARGDAVKPRLSYRGQQFITNVGTPIQQLEAFAPGVPDLSHFPFDAWKRLQNRYWKRSHTELMSRTLDGTVPLLREVLAEHLHKSRSISCSPHQVIITAGIRQSIDLAVRLLCDAGDSVWMEDPCCFRLRALFHSSGLQTHAIAVDCEGLNPNANDLSKPPKLIVVSPSHQYPLGMEMSLIRRRTLLEFARLNRCWIIENDSDGDFQYGKRAIPSLHRLDEGVRVLCVGDFEKSLPGLSIGYIVVPEIFSESFAVLNAELHGQKQSPQQWVLGEFIAEGHWTAYVRRLRTLYGRRREALIETIRNQYGNALPIYGGNAGLDLILSLPSAVDDFQVAEAAFQRGVVTRPLSHYFSRSDDAMKGLVLGFGGVPDEKIFPALCCLTRVLAPELLAARKS